MQERIDSKGSRPVNKGMAGMRADARQIFEDPDIIDKASENQIGRIVKSCAVLVQELGREPIGSEVLDRAERMRREEQDYRQAKFSRRSQATDSGASSSGGTWQGYRHGARAGWGQEQDCENWANMSWRTGSWWSTSTQPRQLHEHDRHNFQVPPNRDHGDRTTDTTWEGTRGGWRERAARNQPTWPAAHARWSTSHGGWKNFI